jgi:predicted transcriptional regulator
MSDESGAIDQIAFLTRSEARVQILTHLLATGPTSRRTFRERLAHSRSTITRALSALVDNGYVDRDADEYRLTPMGHIVADGLDDLVDRVQATDELATFLKWFPYAAHDLDVDQLRDTTVTVSTDQNPFAPARELADRLDTASAVRMVLPSTDRQMVERTRERVLAGDLDLEILISPDLEETVTTEPFAPVVREQIEAGGVTISVCADPVPFYLGLVDDLVLIGVEDDDGFPRALLETDRESAREWGERLFASYREHARTLPQTAF